MNKAWMMMQSRAAMTLLATAVLVTGCGRQMGTMAPLRTGELGASGAVGIPSSYRPGEAMPGQEGTPTLTKAVWPKLSVAPNQKTSDPVNLVVAGTEAQIRHVFSSQGWKGADKLGAISTAKMIKNTITMGDYDTAPMSDLYLYGRVQDMSFQKGWKGTYVRDHLRVWQMPIKDRLGRPFWAIAATKDVAVKWNYKELAPTHQISPDIDAERQVVVDDFLNAGQVKLRYQLQSLPENYKGVNGGGDEFYTDGKVEVLELVVIRPRT
jgi:hypothetical protein